MNRSTSGLLVHHQLPESTQNHVHWVSDAIQPSHPLSSPSPALSLSSGSFQISQFFTSGGQSIGVSASKSVLPMNTQDWSPLGWTIAVQAILKSLIQHHSSKASILRCSAFFIVQLSHPYTTTGKTIALTRQTFVGKITSLLLNMLFMLVILSFQGVSSSYKVANVFEFQFQNQSFQWTVRTDFLEDWLVWSPCSPRDSQQSSTPQFKSINSSVLSFLYSLTLISMHDCWKNHSFE